MATLIGSVPAETVAFAAGQAGGLGVAPEAAAEPPLSPLQRLMAANAAGQLLPIAVLKAASDELRAGIAREKAWIDERSAAESGNDLLVGLGMTTLALVNRSRTFVAARFRIGRLAGQN